MDDHQESVSKIIDRVRDFSQRNAPFRIYHGSTSTTRRTKLSRENVVDTSGLDKVLAVDKERRVAVVEPNVSMAKLVDATLIHGMLPKVVMELPAITVGGGFAGTSGESSSFKWGYFEKTVSRIEIVLADGELVEASREVRPDLLHGAGGSFGTLGVITLLDVDLIPALPFVELRYRQTTDAADAVSITERTALDPKTDYLEGIMLSLNRGVVISGRLTDGQDSKLPVMRFSRAGDPWFYLHVEDVLRGEVDIDNYRELVPLVDYLFRYDRGAFWGGKYSFQYFYMPFNAITRWALDSLLRTKVMYHALHKSHLADEYVVQDIGFPYATLPRFVEWLDERLGFYPLWLCPLKIDEDFALHPRRLAAFEPDAQSPGMMMNVGIWGPGPRQYGPFVEVNRAIETKTKELGGLKCFYAQAFYSKAEFWSIYDKSWYDELRSLYKASGLPSVQQKVNVDLSKWTPTHELPWRPWLYERFKEQWPVKGLYGALQALLGSEYLLG
ncbi:hypothetical protein LTR53_013814 [Teratosphaeriaceae sp. CCFEE 6253]|nr:hypothetical protein LTR53_013814 [Teratosphaeriaceae sp. CCFEE 6253]